MTMTSLALLLLCSAHMQHTHIETGKDIQAHTLAHILSHTPSHTRRHSNNPSKSQQLVESLSFGSITATHKPQPKLPLPLLPCHLAHSNCKIICQMCANSFCVPPPLSPPNANEARMAHEGKKLTLYWEEKGNHRNSQVPAT